MYDTEKSIELVKKRMHEYHCRQERRTVCRLSVLCALCCSCPLWGQWGSCAGGYVLVAVISFTVAVVITALCIKFRKREQKSQDAEDHV